MSTIIFVDDDRAIREMLSVFFQTWGFSCTVVPTARDVIQLLTEGCDTRLVITDILMPDMDGVELAKYVRAHHPSVEIVALTGTERAVENGRWLFREIMHKPVNVEKLRALAEEFSAQPPATSAV